MSDNDQEDGQRPSKRLRLDLATSTSQAEQPHCSNNGQGIARAVSELGERLRKVMLCNVCLELPYPDESYQCKLGHILCEDCVTRLLAEAAIHNCDAHCPHCRTRISWAELTKNLAVGQTLWELPKSCADCDKLMEYKCLANHLKFECGKRRVKCKYRCLGCSWEGCQEASVEHESGCKHIKMSSDQILAELQYIDDKDYVASLATRQCYRQMRAKRIFYEDLELHWPSASASSSTSTYQGMLFYSPTIYVFEDTWRLLVKLNSSTETSHFVSCSLKLLSTPRRTVAVKYFITLPASSVRNKYLTDVLHQLHTDQFTHAGQKSEFRALPMDCPTATYRLLAMPRIKLRLWMMLQ